MVFYATLNHPALPRERREGLIRDRGCRHAPGDFERYGGSGDPQGHLQGLDFFAADKPDEDAFCRFACDTVLGRLLFPSEYTARTEAVAEGRRPIGGIRGGEGP